MSNSIPYYETTPIKKENRDFKKPKTGYFSSPNYSNANTHLKQPEWLPSTSQQTESYIDILADSGEDWLDSYDFTTTNDNNNNNNSKKTLRRTLTTSQSEKQHVMVRKTRSLRENSRQKLRSPPPPKGRKSGFVEDLPTLPENSQPRKTVSSSIIHHNRRSQNITSVLSDYQGYSQSNHRTFTYSPPPPSPRTSSFHPVDVPSIPPVPPMPKIHTSTKLKTKRNDPSSQSSSSRPTSNASNHTPYKFEILKLQKELETIITDSKLASPSITSSILNLPTTNLTPTTSSDYAINLSNDLAQIEQDIKVLELERVSFIKQKQPEIPAKTIGRKRGKTLPGSLATPPPIPTATLPPMTLNPIQMSIPNNIKKKRSPPTAIKLQPSTSTPKTSKFKSSFVSSLDKHSEKVHKHDMGMGPGYKTIEKKPSLSNPKTFKRKSHAPVPSQSQSTEVRRTMSFKQPKTVEEKVATVHHERKKSLSPEHSGGRSPKSVQTTLKYYSPYLSDYERQIEIHDYQHIYFVGPHAQNKKHGQSTNNAFNFGYDDERGDYKIVIQDHLAYRYEVIEVLGRGSFGQVVKCYDHKTSQMVAIKLIRNKKRFHAQALTEVNILKNLVMWDPDDHYNTIKMTDHFYFRNHLCIAFECLCMNLYEFIKSNHFQGFSVGLIKKITYQIIQSLLLLAEHDLIHCDLKPENIMLKHPGRSSIKVIDFGSSCFETERVYTYIQSRFYRSPEVILGISYHKGIDMWSLGCIIAELYTGIPIFPGENEQEQLSCIMEVMGIPDRHIIERCSRRKLFFDSVGNPRIVANSKGKRRIPGTKSLFKVLKCHDTVFIDFIERCLRWDPSRRMTPKQALQHEWMTGSIPATPQLASFLSPPAMAYN